MLYQTLSETLDAAIEYASNNKIEIENQDLLDEFQYGGIAYGNTRQGTVEIKKLCGRNTRKCFQISIYRTTRGLYELTCYSL